MKGRLKLVILGVVSTLSYNCLSQTNVYDCTSGVVDNNAEDGIIINGDCGKLTDPVGTVSGNIELKSSSNLTIDADITTIAGNVEVKSSSSLTINANITEITGNIEIKTGGTLIINGDISNINGSITNHGILLITGNVTAEGKLEIKGTGTATLDGGTFSSTQDKIEIKPSSTLELINGSSITSFDPIENNGTIDSDCSGNSIHTTITGSGSIPPCMDCSSIPCTDGGSKPTITLSTTNGNVCFGNNSTSIAYSSTTGNPDEYNIDFDAAAEAQGFVDISNSILGTSPILITVPVAASAGTYNGDLTVHDTALNSTSDSYAITITVIELPSVVITSDISSQCYDEIAVNFQLTATVSNGTANYDYVWTELTGPHGSISSPLNIVGSANTTNIQSFDVVSDGNPIDSNEDYTIQVEITDGNGCSATDDYTFTVTRIPLSGEVYRLSNSLSP